MKGPERRLRAVGLAAVVALAMGMTGGVVVSPAAAADAAPPCGQSPTSPTFDHFKDEAPQPPVAAPDSPNHYTLTAHTGTHEFQTGKGKVPTLGYSTANAAVDYLGPTIVTQQGTPIDVKIVNALPTAGTPMPWYCIDTAASRQSPATARRLSS